MHLIKLNATDSTNRYLKSLMSEESLEDYTVVMALNQTSGRGQMGTVWETKPGKNLTVSVLKRTGAMCFPNIFDLNICVSLAVYNVLQSYNVPNVKIKWPNDIMSGSSKICGILIENILSGNNMSASVIGIGLNVNQRDFGMLPKVTSMSLLLGKELNLNQIVQKLVDELKTMFTRFELEGVNMMEKNYSNLLFRKDKPSTFKDSNNELFMGIIKGVSKEGKLLVSLENEILKEFDLKEISLLY